MNNTEDLIHSRAASVDPSSSRCRRVSRRVAAACSVGPGKKRLSRSRDALAALFGRRRRVSRDVDARERSKAARALTTLFTVAATRIVLDEEYSYDNEGGETPLARELTQFLSERPVGRDGDGWLRALLRESHTLRLAALRIIELRESYAREDFDFERVRVTAMDEVKTANDALMVGYVQRSM